MITKRKTDDGEGQPSSRGEEQHDGAMAQMEMEQSMANSGMARATGGLAARISRVLPPSFETHAAAAVRRNSSGAGVKSGLTVLASPINTVAAPRAVMLTIAQVSVRDGVSKPAVSTRVKKFVERHGLTVERSANGRVACLNIAEYDALRSRYDNPSKAQAKPKPEAATPPSRGRPAPLPPAAAPAVLGSLSLDLGDESYDEALRQKTWIDAETRRISLDAIKGKILDTQSVVEGYDRTAGIVHDVIGRIEEHADDLAAIVGREGARGLAPALKKLGATMLAEIATALRGEAQRLRDGIAEDPPQGQLL